MADETSNYKVMALKKDNVYQVSEWCKGVVVEEIDPVTNQRYPALNVLCGDDVKRASIDDCVVQDTNGEFNVMKPNEFIRRVLDN